MLAILRKIIATQPSTENLKIILKAAESQRTVVPTLDVQKCNDCRKCTSLCPTRALEFHTESKKFEIKGELCIRCGRCIADCSEQALSYGFRLPVATRKKDTFHQTYQWRGNHYEFQPEPVSEPVPNPDSVALQSLLKRSFVFRELDTGSCNACEVEVNLLTAPQYDAERLGMGCTASPRFADALLVTGPVSRNMKLAAERTFQATPTPKVVIAMGSCAISGGIYRDSYAVHNGTESVMPVDVYIPGCPPSPPSLIYGLLLAANRIKE